ncbi:MAG: DUF7168 domain-containing protein, partial [Rhodobacterales bacterium]
GHSPRDPLWGTIGRCTNSAPVLDTSWDPVVTFIGHAPGPEIACYLVEVLNRSIDREILTFKASREYKRRRTVGTRRAAAHDFTAALVFRLRQRLLEMFAASVSDEAFEKAKEVLQIRMPGTTSSATSSKKMRFGSAAAAGYAAGSRVNISRGVNAGRPVSRIGSD